MEEIVLVSTALAYLVRIIATESVESIENYLWIFLDVLCSVRSKFSWYSMFHSQKGWQLNFDFQIWLHCTVCRNVVKRQMSIQLFQMSYMPSSSMRSLSLYGSPQAKSPSHAEAKFTCYKN
jgi:hypothetical protein